MQTFIIKTINVCAQLFHVNFKVYDVMSTPVFIARENATHLQIKKNIHIRLNYVFHVNLPLVLRHYPMAAR